MNFWEWVKYIDWKVESVFGLTEADRVSAASHAESLYAVTHPTNAQDRAINDAINSYKIKHTGILGVLDNIGDQITFIVKNLPLFIVLIVLIVLFIYVLPLFIKNKSNA